MKFISLVVLIILSFTVFSGEVDQFTNRNENLKDSREKLNILTNAKIQGFLKKFAKSKNKVNCKDKDPKKIKRFKKALYVGLRDALNTEPISSIHEEVNDPDGTFDYTKIHYPSSIYQKTSYNESALMATGHACCSRLINISDKKGRNNLVGIDKISHFFTHGLEYYRAYVKQKGTKKKKIEAALKVGDEKEFGYWGKLSTGVVSHGDMAANIAGFYFWLSILDTKNPLIKCNSINGRFVQARPFDWGEYVTAGWDEAINCSDFQYSDDKNSEFRKRIIRNIEKSSKGSKKCPLKPEKCLELVKYYGKYAKRILHKDCYEQGSEVGAVSGISSATSNFKLLDFNESNKGHINDSSRYPTVDKTFKEKMMDKTLDMMRKKGTKKQ